MSTYKNWHTSVLAIAKQIKDGLSSISPHCQVIDADGAVEIGDMPDTDWIGIGDFEWVADGNVTVSFTLVISTHDDKGLFRLRDMADYAAEKLLPDTTYNLVNPAGTKVGSIKLMGGTTVSASREVGTRPVRLVQVRAVGGHAEGGP